MPFNVDISRIAKRVDKSRPAIPYHEPHVYEYVDDFRREGAPTSGVALVSAITFAVKALGLEDDGGVASSNRIKGASLGTFDNPPTP